MSYMSYVIDTQSGRPNRYYTTTLRTTDTHTQLRTAHMLATFKTKKKQYKHKHTHTHTHTHTDTHTTTTTKTSYAKS